MSTDGSLDVQDSERIQFQMDRIRHHLDDDVEGIVANAQEIFSWRYYVKRYPIGSLAAVAAVGFLLVPRPKAKVEKRVYLDRESARELASSQSNLYVEPAEGASPGFIKSAGIMAANALVRAGIAYAGQRLGKQTGESAASETSPQ